MMPARSHRMPESAPKVSGVAAVSIDWIMPVMFNWVPLVIQTRNPNAARNASPQERIALTVPSVRTRRSPAKRMHTLPMVYSVAREGRVNRFPNVWSVKVAWSPGWAPNLPITRTAPPTMSISSVIRASFQLILDDGVSQTI